MRLPGLVISFRVEQLDEFISHLFLSLGLRSKPNAPYYSLAVHKQDRRSTGYLVRGQGASLYILDWKFKVLEVFAGFLIGIRKDRHTLYISLRRLFNQLSIERRAGGAVRAVLFEEEDQALLILLPINVRNT